MIGTRLEEHQASVGKDKPIEQICVGHPSADLEFFRNSPGQLVRLDRPDLLEHDALFGKRD